MYISILSLLSLNLYKKKYILIEYKINLIFIYLYVNMYIICMYT